MTASSVTKIIISQSKFVSSEPRWILAPGHPDVGEREVHLGLWCLSTTPAPNATPPLCQKLEELRG